MRSGTTATAATCVVFLSVLLGLSSGVRGADDFLLLVNPNTGQVAMRSDFPSTVWINQYSIASPSGSLTPTTWSSLEDQNADPLAGWGETSSITTLVSESAASGETSFQNGTGFQLGQLFDFAGIQILEFQYRLAGSATPSDGVVSYGSFTAPPNPVHEPIPEPLLLGDANNDGQVTGADLISVQQNFGNVGAVPLQGDANNDGQVTGADLISVQQNFGNVLAPAGAKIPEPGTMGLMLIGAFGFISRKAAKARSKELTG